MSHSWGASKTNTILSRLNGHRILVVGNHDMNKGKLKTMDFKECHLIYVMDSNDTPPIVITHYPFENCPPGWINVHGHVHNNQYDGNLQHVNVSVEVIDYTPIHWNRIKEIARTRHESMEL